ncbi:AAA family ATPase [Streptomyces sp. NBC_00459]|uniref:AAA family ATPase n=1 Tax=Streptomyces sp. NBC_00459 TaxID=2975749 RepID=UPI002E184FF7
MTTQGYPNRATLQAMSFFPQAVDVYRRCEWNALPMPRRKKSPPPEGYTGNTNAMPNVSDVERWKHDKAYEFGNVALRMPRDVIGIDVDAYKGGLETLAELEDKLGALPKTWSSTSKTDGSRIMFFRVQPDKKWPGDLGAGIEVIQRTHRYAVVYPSKHPDTNAQYRWLNKHGRKTEQIPMKSDLAALPRDWQEELLSGKPTSAAAGNLPPQNITDAETSEWLNARPTPDSYPCPLMDGARWQAREALGVSGHDSAKAATWQLVNLAREGHRGINKALAGVEDDFVEAVKDRRPSEEEARDEFAKLVIGAVGKARTTDALPPCYCTGVEDVAAEDDDERLAAFEAEFLTTDDLDKIEPPKYLIKGQLTKNTTARLNGAPGSNKSIIALDMAACVAAGVDWKGHKVRPDQGKVVYLYAEGREGLPRRVRAWEKFHDRKMTGVVFLPRPVLISNKAEWKRLIAFCEKTKPALIVLDTQARIFAGIVENDNAEMGLAFEEAIEKLRRATEACVLLIHHSTGETEKGRGASVITGALNTEIFVEREGDIVTIKNTKEKDEADSTIVKMKRLILDSGLKDEDGEALTSVVLQLVSEMDNAGFTLVNALSAHKQTIVDVVNKAESGLRYAEAKRALSYTPAEGKTVGKFSESAFKRYWSDLVKARILKKSGVFYTVDEYALNNYLKEQN